MKRIADRFVLEREIGSGGMARVFLGRDEVLDRPVAVKMLRPGFVGTDISDRFQREGRTSARLSHPNIVQVYDAGESGFEGRDASYIVMEYVDGGDLKEKIQHSRTLGTHEASRLAGQVARGLAHAHGRGIVHRDIKPHNILLDSSGSPKVADFGIARALEATRMTRTGAFLGTAVYSSPEQLKGEGVTPKTDVYALGVTLFQALSGEPPFLGDTPIEVAGKHLSETPQAPLDPAKLREPEAGMWRLVLDCLAKDPAERPDAEELASKLEEVAAVSGRSEKRDHRVTASTSATLKRETPPAGPSDGLPDGRSGNAEAKTSVTPVRRRRSGRGMGLAALAVVALVLVVGAVALLSSLGDGTEDQTPRQPDVAQESGSGQSGSGQGGGSSGQGSGEEAQTGAGGGQEGAQQESASVGAGAAGSDTGQGDRSQAAAGTVEDVYSMAASGDYGASYDMLSSGFRASSAPTEAEWSGQFDTLRSIEFVGEPEVTVSGDTATVSGETEAVHTDRTERNTAVWTLVQEDGEWKLDDIQIQSQEIV